MLKSIFVNNNEIENNGTAINKRVENFLCAMLRYSAIIAISLDVIGKITTLSTARVPPIAPSIIVEAWLTITPGPPAVSNSCSPLYPSNKLMAVAAQNITIIPSAIIIQNENFTTLIIILNGTGNNWCLSCMEARKSATSNHKEDQRKNWCMIRMKLLKEISGIGAAVETIPISTLSALIKSNAPKYG